MNKLYKFVNGKRVKALKNKQCPVCKKVFSPNCSKSIYCSKPCYYEMKRIRGDRVKWTDEMRQRVSKRMSGKNNHWFGRPGYWIGKKRLDISGKNSSLWKGGCRCDKNGIIWHNINGKEVPEHRLVMEIKLNRKLTSEDIVHHIDGNKSNNKLNNLQLVNRKEHINIHRKDLKRLPSSAARLDALDSG